MILTKIQSNQSQIIICILIIYIGLVKIRLVMVTTYLPLMLHGAQEFFFLEWRALGYTKLFVDVVGYATGFCT